MAPSNTSPMAQLKADSSSKPNTPSSIKFSPMTLFSQTRESLFGISRSPITGSPRKMETKTNNLPKNNSPASAGFATKKIKEKTRGTVNALALASPKRFVPFKLDNPPKAKPNRKPKPLACKVEPNANTARPAQACTFGMLKDYKRRYIQKEKALPRPESKLLRANKDDWRGPPYGGESMPYPHRARTMQDDLHTPVHTTAMNHLWGAFVKHIRSAFGLRDNEIPDFPQHLDDTIPRKPRDDGN